METELSIIIWASLVVPVEELTISVDWSDIENVFQTNITPCNDATEFGIENYVLAHLSLP